MPKKKEYTAKEFVELLNKKDPKLNMTVSKLNYLRLKNDGSVKFRKVYDTFVYHE
jgi:hypothetical protein